MKEIKKIKKIKKINLLLIIFFTVFTVFTVNLLTGCAKDNLKAPCPKFGKYCQKIPINSWDYYHSV